MRAQFIHIDQAAVLRSRITLDVNGDVSGRLYLPDQEVELSKVSAAYFRPYDTLQLGPIQRAGPASEEWARALAFDCSLWLWAEQSSALVLNRPQAMASNNSKPYQSGL